MKITDLLSVVAIDVEAKPTDKKEAILQLTKLMEKQGNINNREAYEQDIWKREELSTTGIGAGIGIPHAQSSAVVKAGLSAMVVKHGVDFDSLDQQPTHLFFMIAVPNDGGTEHLKILQSLSKMLMDSEFKETLLHTTDAQAFRDCIDEKEEQLLEEEKPQVVAATSHYDVLAVTACPTGIAHTYMAAEALEKMADTLDIHIKVETNGSGGAKNILTKEDIEQAKCIIVAADKKVEMARFHGKHVLQTKVADGVHKPKELLEKAMQQEAPIYQSGMEETQESDSTGIIHTFYKHLMNGISNALPFAIGSGVLVALTQLLVDNNIAMDSELPYFLYSIGGIAFTLIFPIIAAFIAESIADRPGFLAGFIGGYIASGGGAGFIGTLLAGFIAGYLVYLVTKLASYLPDTLEGIKPTLIYPLVGIIGIGAIFIYLLNPTLSDVNTSIMEGLQNLDMPMKVLIGVILGGMMSIDMGGPINKTAYVLGVGTVASGSYEIMASVMVGGMVPPLAISLASVLFRTKFAVEERKVALKNSIMGLCFMTEGAVPFAKREPRAILPACTIGSAVAGGLSMYFGCALMTPHGGIFVFGLATNPLQYVMTLLVGIAVSVVVLGILKKKTT